MWRDIVKRTIVSVRRPVANRATATALSGMTGLRINVGAGLQSLDGWINTDVSWRARNYLDAAKPWPVADGAVELLYGDQMIEHLTLAQARQFFRTAARVLGHGGTLRLTTPDVERTARMYLEGGEAAFEHLQRHRDTGGYREVEHLVDLMRLTFSSGHRLGYMWDYAALGAELRQAGFVNIRRCENGKSSNPLLSGLESRVERTVEMTILIVEADRP